MDVDEMLITVNPDSNDGFRREARMCRIAFAGMLGLVMGLMACHTPGNAEPDDRAPPEESGDLSAQVEWSEPVDVATGNAYRGPWRMNESDFHYVDDPAVAFGPDGSLLVVWVDNEAQDVFFQRYGADGDLRLPQATNISESSDVFSWLPRVASSPVDDDVVYAVWQEIVFSGGSHGGEIFFAKSTDGGRNFEGPVNLSETIAGAGKGRLTADRWNNGSLDIVVDDDAELYVAWTEYEGALRFRRSSDGAETFDEPIHVAGTAEEPARAPSLAVGNGDRLYLAWAVGEDDTSDIELAVSTDDGASFEQRPVPVETDGHSDAPDLAADGDALYLAYGESPGGRFATYDVWHTRSFDGGETFEEPARLSEGEDFEGEGANFPSMTIDDDGRLFVVWEHYPDPRQRPVGLGFTSSDDGGETFDDPSIVPGSVGPELGINGGLQGLLMSKIAVDDRGSVAVGHSTFLEGEESRVRLLRGEWSDQ